MIRTEVKGTFSILCEPWRMGRSKYLYSSDTGSKWGKSSYAKETHEQKYGGREE